MQKAIQNALAQQKTENQTLIKKVTELQSQMTQQAQVSALQTVEPVRQPRGPPSSLQTEEGLKNYYASEYLKEIGVLNKAKLDADYLVKPFQRPRQQRNNNSARIDRMEEGLNETRDAVNELRGISHKLAGNTNAISPSKSSQPKTYDELLPKLLPAMRKMCLSQNLRTVEALEWKVNKPSKFAVKGNSKYISEALGWYTNVAVTLKNMKGNPIITIVGNYACVDNVKDLPKKEQDQVSTNSSSLTVLVNFLLIHVNLYIRVVLAVKPLSFSPQLTRFLRRDSTLAFQDVSDKLSEEEITSFLLFFSTILVASVTDFSSILTFFFQPFFFGISVAGRDIDDTSDTALRVIQTIFFGALGSVGFWTCPIGFFNWTILDCPKPVLDIVLDIVLDSLKLLKSPNIY
ncbi:uncharacterized protein OCT59_012014 [Rhizophagus irregularis]|uniref:uncharacterized protein n=1 Tax=Rhizophagus irregularis TaxID=588596 RepID=UPI00332C2F0C|nr:hypothetical protein OCT59_012014 [Rhizophagus irregularis]